MTETSINTALTGDDRKAGIAGPLLLAFLVALATAVLALQLGGGFFLALLGYSLGGSVALVVFALLASR